MKSAGRDHALIKRAERFLSNGKYWKAHKILRRLLTRQPDNPTLHCLTGYCQRKLRNYPAARAHLDAACKANPEDPQIAFQAGCLAHDLGDYQEADKWYRRTLEQVPRWAEAWSSLGDTSDAIGRPQEAEFCYRKALEIAPTLSGAAFNLAAVLFDDRNLNPTRAALEHALRLDPKIYSAAFHLAIIDWLEGNQQSAAARLSHLHPSRSDYLASSLEALREWTDSNTRFFGSTVPTLSYAAEQANEEGLILEFGVNWGTTIRQLAALTEREVHGFDSFEGLPEPWEGEKAGSYSTFGTLPRVPKTVILHKGWFRDTLPTFFASTSQPVALANIDCDLYSSTVEVLAHIGPLLRPGSILLFDEFFGYRNWQNHEYRAFGEYVHKHDISFRFLAFGLFSHQAVVRIES